jgi:hypothetical protein
MEIPITILTIAEWDALHTKDGPKVGDPGTGRELFPDGAMRDGLGNGHEPPTEPGELLRAKQRYVALKLRLEVERFEHFQNECKEVLANKVRYANTLPGPAPNAKEQLERGAERIANLREELAGLDREISQLPDERARRSYLEQRRVDQSATKELLNEIIGVQI